MSPIAILVHGGAGPQSPDDVAAEREQGALRAARAGHEVLRRGGSAVEAVTVAARLLEDDPQFNAGTGGALNADGEVELDASIMDGATLAAGAVACVRTVKNPVLLARKVMEATPHVLFAGAGADRLARELGFPAVAQADLITPRARAALERSRAVAAPKGHGTIGAVALDAQGHVAAATSTGGTHGKRPGRVGDSPLIGAGTYADDRAGAVSATGSGEFFIRAVVAHEICARARLAGQDVLSAARATIADMGALGGTGGVIVVGPDGRGGWAFNSKGMYRGKVSSGQNPVVALYGEE